MNIKHNVVEQEFKFHVRLPDGTVTTMPIISDSQQHARMELERAAREEGFEILPEQNSRERKGGKR